MRSDNCGVRPPAASASVTRRSSSRLQTVASGKPAAIAALAGPTDAEVALMTATVGGRSALSVVMAAPSQLLDGGCDRLGELSAAGGAAHVLGGGAGRDGGRDALLDEPGGANH